MGCLKAVQEGHGGTGVEYSRRLCVRHVDNRGHVRSRSHPIIGELEGVSEWGAARREMKVWRGSELCRILWNKSSKG